jgi:hypothetical protein
VRNASAALRNLARHPKKDFFNTIGQKRKCRPVGSMSALLRILLQKSKLASVRILDEALKREPIDDSYNLSRVTEVANEFSVRRWGPSDLYTKTEPAALGIFVTFCKTTFATESS